MMFLKAVSAARRVYPVITDGLKLYLDAYNLDSYSGSGGTWTDLSNSGYNFTITGPTWTTSGGRRYFEFDGVNDRMEGATDSSNFNIGTTGYTWSIWIYYVSAPASQAVTFPDVIIGMGLYAAQSYAYPFFTDNRSNDSGNSSSTGQGYMMGVYLNSTAYHTTKAETVPTGSWFQLTFTMTYSTSTTGTFRIYKDGAEITNEAHTLSSGTWATANITRKPTVGCINVDGTFSRFNNIRVGEILRYNRPLTATEVDNNYQSTKTNYGL